MDKDIGIKPIHPFPARMAPSIAISALRKLPANSVVLDPMAGSGTVLRHASELGHRAIGYDMDPLAILMARVWTTPIDGDALTRLSEEVLREAREQRLRDVDLPEIDDDSDTRVFVDYWFGAKQRNDLRKLAYCLRRLRSKRRVELRAAADVLRIAFSRLIITKDVGASLARDVSHSRPHRVEDTSTFEVFPAFVRSVNHVKRLLLAAPPPGRTEVREGDARRLHSLNRNSVDAVLTSPPYLNAIDYMRGHRMSLIWLGYRLDDLRAVRAESIGAERRADNVPKPVVSQIAGSMTKLDRLSDRHAQMVLRFAGDLQKLMSEVARVVKPDGRAILVVGNSCLRDTFIRNSEGVIAAAKSAGLRLSQQVERNLPANKRYLPSVGNSALAKRMRTETVLTFKHAA